MSSPPKVAKMNPYIGTHNADFHCDDVTACYMLKALDRFKNHDIVRTRDPDLLAKAEIAVDVGGELNIDRLRLDHHQRSFDQTIHDYYPKLRVTNPNKPPRLSSAGLVFAIFGKDYIVKQLNLGKSHYVDLDDEQKKMIDVIFEKAYIEFMEEIDAIDNGIDVASGDSLVYNYYINSGISSRVGRLNPSDQRATDEERLELFKKAMKMVGDEMSEGIQFLGTVWWPRRQQFRDMVLKREQLDPSGQIVHLESDCRIGWKSALFDLEEDLGVVGQLKYVVYQDTNQWRITAMPTSLKSFHCRVPLREEWRGKRDEELQKVSGIADATFVHASGFTGGAHSFEGIMSLAHKSLAP